MENSLGTRSTSPIVVNRLRSFRWMLLAAGLAGCRPTRMPDPEPSRAASEPAVEAPAVVEPAEFATWPRMTEHQIQVHSYLWMMCRRLTPEEEKEAAEERDRYGPHHRYSIMVRVSPDGAAAYRDNRPLPVGAVVVKEKYIGRGSANSLRAYAVMTKRRKESPARGGGWEYAYVDLSPGREVSSGSLNHCAECHASARDRDFLFRSRHEAGR